MTRSWRVIGRRSQRTLCSGSTFRGPRMLHGRRARMRGFTRVGTTAHVRAERSLHSYRKRKEKRKRRKQKPRGKWRKGRKPFVLYVDAEVELHGQHQTKVRAEATTKDSLKSFIVSLSHARTRTNIRVKRKRKRQQEKRGEQK